MQISVGELLFIGFLFVAHTAIVGIMHSVVMRIVMHSVVIRIVWNASYIACTVKCILLELLP